jgi:chemotaxis protein MotB
MSLNLSNPFNFFKVMVIAIMGSCIIQLSSCVAKKKYKSLETQYNSLNGNYNELTGKYGDLNKAKTEGEKMSNAELSKLNNELKQKLSDLEKSNNRVVELQNSMQRQKKSQQELLGKITNALIGFNSSDLTADIREDGRVYVSLSEKLLFKSGKYDVDPKGKEALQKLATVLSSQPDIDIIVEGHTDSIPLKNGGVLKDNIDLSVLRATSIVRLLSNEYGVNSKQLYSSGRGDNFPMASNSTPEGRAINRRTDIILAPKISELYKIIAGN